MSSAATEPLAYAEGVDLSAPFAARLTRVSKVFDPTSPLPPVLEGVSLTVAPGEFVSLLGASGCGKSTILNLIAGLDKPTSGTVELPSSRRPALMFQESALLPWLSAGRNIDLALKLRGMPGSDRRTEVERLLELVHLRGNYDKKAHELSGGMRQRVALARALAQDTSVLLMDEPFAALDAITRDVLHEELINIWTREKLAVVFVTHNVREAVRLGQRVLLMSSRPGRMVREWNISIDGPRRIESPAVAELSLEITDDLRREIRRHGHH